MIPETDIIASVKEKRKTYFLLSKKSYCANMSMSSNVHLLVLHVGPTYFLPFAETSSTFSVVLLFLLDSFLGS